MKYIIFFALGALALRLAETLWQMVVGTPVPESERAVTRDGGITCESCDRAAFYSSVHTLKDSGGTIAYYWCKMHAPEEATSFDEDGGSPSPTEAHACGDCGTELQIVRPGKYQCVKCESDDEARCFVYKSTWYTLN